MVGRLSNHQACKLLPEQRNRDEAGLAALSAPGSSATWLSVFHCKLKLLILTLDKTPRGSSLPSFGPYSQIFYEQMREMESNWSVFKQLWQCFTN